MNKISFRGESSNLLQNFRTYQAASAQTLPGAAPSLDNTRQDVFQKADAASFVKEYGGITALAVSVLGIPAAYIVSGRSSAKAMKSMQTALREMTENFNNLNSRYKKILENVENAQKNKSPVSKKSRLVTMLLGLGSGFGIGEFLKNSREKLKTEYGFTDDEINEASRTATEILETPKTAVNRANEAYELASGMSSKADKALTASEQARNTAASMDIRINDARNRADEALGAAVSGIKPESRKFVEKYYDLWIMKYPGWQSKINNSRTEKAMAAVRNAGVIRLDRSAEDTLKHIKAYKENYKDQLTSLWQITSEFKPIKSGGLGDVPPDLQNNFADLGIDSPIFIPMYETPGVSGFINDEALSYRYKDKSYDLKKVAEMDIEVFRNGTTSFSPVQLYMADDNGKKLIFVRNKSFKGGMYDNTAQGDEAEKFTILTRAVYDLAKAKVAEALGCPVKNPSYIKKGSAYYELQAPNSMILNDWQSGSMAGLLRYRAPMEYNYDEIDDNVFNALSEMPLLMIGHNLTYQGQSNADTSSVAAKNNITQNMINTLFGKFALGVVENAHSGIDNEDMCSTVLLKRKTDDKQFNSLFNGIALSDWFVPVSKNYAREVVNDDQKSRITKPLLERRSVAGTLAGIVNGTDKVNHGINKSGNKKLGISYVNYDQYTDIDTIMERRLENKKQFYDKVIVPLMRDKTLDKLVVIRPEAGRNISEQEFMDAPLISFAHRLGDDQKGLKLLKGAIFMLFDNWQDEFGDKPKPFFFVGGPEPNEDNEKCLDDLKNPDYGTDKSRVDYIMALKGFMPNPAIQAVSTFFMAPSTFEPCGLTQGECFAKGTPIIATNTGGFPDTVVDGKTGFLAPYISEESVYETLVRALKMYYNEPEKYKEMVKNTLEVDFSWAQAGRKGSIYEYTDKLGFDREDLPDIGTIKAAA